MNTDTLKRVMCRVVSAAMTEWDSACDDKGRRTVFGIRQKNLLHGVAAKYSLIFVCYKKKHFQNLINSTQEVFKKNLQALK